MLLRNDGQAHYSSYTDSIQPGEAVGRDSLALFFLITVPQLLEA